MSTLTGRKQSPEHIQKRVQARRDNGSYKHSEETKRLFSKVFTGRKHTEEWKKKMSERMKASHPMKGRKHTPESRAKMSASTKGVPRPDLRGENAPGWKGGKTEEAKIIRCGLEYRLWRESVFKRDDFTCQECGIRGGKLNADHIKPFALFPEFRFAIDNGRTLCVPCHKQTPTYGWRMKKYQMEELVQM